MKDKPCASESKGSSLRVSALRLSLLKNAFAARHQLTPLLLAMLQGFLALGHPLDTWHLRHQNTGGDLTGVCYGESLFVAVGSGGTIYSSETGNYWTPQVSGTTAFLRGVTYGKGMFIAVGANGTIISSRDGTNWTAQASGETNVLASVLFGGDSFVAVGRKLALTSKDGILWSRHVIEPELDSTRLAYGNGLFLAGGWHKGTNLVSTDGANWSELPAANSLGRWGMGFGLGVFLLIDNSGHIFASKDAKEWAEMGQVPVLRPPRVVYGHGYLVTAGPGAAAYSVDGRAWVEAPTALTPRDLCFGNGTFVAVGFDARIVQSDPILLLASRRAGILEVFGPVGQALKIETTDKLGADKGWSVLANLILRESPEVWSETNSAGGHQRFYRAVLDR